MTVASAIPVFCQGIQYFGQPLPNFDRYGQEAAIAQGQTAITSPSDPTTVYQTLLATDALRNLADELTKIM
ncbi:MAG: hypothetical protein VKJ02_05660 [Snowella sp.]|nr:hypothetical protein [Snowella sp.]